MNSLFLCKVSMSNSVTEICFELKLGVLNGLVELCWWLLESAIRASIQPDARLGASDQLNLAMGTNQ